MLISPPPMFSYPAWTSNSRGTRVLRAAVPAPAPPPPRSPAPTIVVKVNITLDVALRTATNAVLNELKVCARVVKASRC